MAKAEQQVMGHEEYRKAYIGCLDWLANTKHRLQRLSDYSGDKRTLQDRLQQLRVCRVLQSVDVNLVIRIEIAKTNVIRENASQLLYALCPKIIMDP